MALLLPSFPNCWKLVVFAFGGFEDAALRGTVAGGGSLAGGATPLAEAGEHVQDETPDGGEVSHIDTDGRFAAIPVQVRVG